MARKHVTSLNLTEIERENLKVVADKMGTTMSDILRSGMLVMFERHLPLTNYVGVVDDRILNVVNRILDERGL